jgi:hypothetical protein
LNPNLFHFRLNYFASNSIKCKGTKGLGRKEIVESLHASGRIGGKVLVLFILYLRISEKTFIQQRDGQKGAMLLHMIWYRYLE